MLRVLRPCPGSVEKAPRLILMAMGKDMGSGASVLCLPGPLTADSLLLLRVNFVSVLSSTWRLRELEAPKALASRGCCFFPKQEKDRPRA